MKLLWMELIIIVLSFKHCCGESAIHFGFQLVNQSMTWFILSFPGPSGSNHPNDNQMECLNKHLNLIGFFSCDQAALWMVQSVRLSVCLSVCPSVCLSHLFDYVPIIVSSWNFRESLPVTEVTSMQKVKVRGQRLRSQRSQPHFTVSGL